MVPAASALEGVNVSIVLALLNDVVPGTVFPPESFSVNDAELGTTAWENVTDGSVETGLLDEPAAGVTDDTAGAVAVGV